MLQTAGAVVEKEQRACLVVEPGHAEEETEVSDAGDEEGFLGGCCGDGFVKPEADEEVGGKAHDLPAQEEQQEAVGDDDAEHGSGEECEETEEACEVFVVRHVADAKDEDERAYEGDHQQHDGGERVEEPADLHPVCA